MRTLAVVLILAAMLAAESGKNPSASKGTAPPVVVSPVVSSVAAPPRSTAQSKHSMDGRPARYQKRGIRVLHPKFLDRLHT